MSKLILVIASFLLLVSIVSLLAPGEPPSRRESGTSASKNPRLTNLIIDPAPTFIPKPHQ